MNQQIRLAQVHSLGLLVDIALSAYLALTLIFATSMPYFWVGVTPFWLLLSIGGYGILLLLYPGRRSLSLTITELMKPIIIGWLGFCAVILFRDLVAGSLGTSFTDRFGVNLASLFMMILFVSAIRIVNTRILIFILSFAFTIPAIISISQFYGSASAWSIPDRISSFSSRDMAYYDNVIKGRSAEEIDRGFSSRRRTRGLNIFIHKYAAVQGTAAAIFLSIGVMSFGNRALGKLSAPVLVAGIVALLGAVLSYSRSVWLGLILVMLLLIYHTFKGGRVLMVFGIFGVLGLSAVALLSLGVFEFVGASRLFSFGANNNISDFARIESMKYSINLFLSNPLFGVGTGGLTSGVPTHNMPLRILGDYGLFGFPFYVWVWFGILTIIRQGLKVKFGQLHVVSVTAVGGIFMMGVDCMTHSSGLLHRGPDQAAFAGVVIGLIFAARAFPRSP